MAEKRMKRYVSDNAHLMAEWNWEKNTDVSPSQVTLGSNKKMWWKCSKGHEWQAAICSRNTGYGCPYCSGRFAVKGQTDLLTVNPILAKEWNYERNNGLTPADILPNSNKKVWWKCIKGHEWQSTVYHRNKGHGCPYCSGRFAIKNQNDLQTQKPYLVNEWDFEKNVGLTPADVTPNSSKKVWWKCKKGHQWQTTIHHRSRGEGCPICNSERRTSFPEYALVYYLEKHGLRTLHTYKKKGYELDVYIPSLNVAVEYDGYYWHKDKVDEDLEKNSKCKKDGIKLYRVREGLIPLNDSSIDYVVQKNQKNLSKILGELLSVIIGTSVDIDLERDAFEIDTLREYTEKEKSLLVSNPKIAKEWNYEKNGNLKPENFTANSDKRVWWKCSKGHEWQATIGNRNKGRGCPYCSGRKVLKGYNDIKTVSQALMKEWNYVKNGNLKPENFTANSGKKVWWKCTFGHEWYTTIDSRNKGRGCPYCAGQKVLKGYNDLETKMPNMLMRWHPTKNNKLKPSDVLSKSKLKVWWLCPLGHEYVQSIDKRTDRKQSCPYCSNHKVWQGLNDFATKHPEIAKEWHSVKNGDLKPSDVTYGSGKCVWWKCPIGHEYQAVVRDRGVGQTNCPVCNARNLTSFGEQAVLYYVKKVFPDALSRYKELFDNSMEFDVFIPNHKIAIEYDGAY